jgi:hypothetical protein
MVLNIPALSNGQNGENQLLFFTMQYDFDMDKRIRRNLQRLIDTYDQGNQSAFARRVGLRPTFINGVLGEGRTLGKELIEQICKKLGIDLIEFLMTDKTPIVTTAEEERAVYRARAAGKLGPSVLSRIEAVDEAIIKEAKKNAEPGSEGTKGGVPGSGHRKRRAS